MSNEKKTANINNVKKIIKSVDSKDKAKEREKNNSTMVDANGKRIIYSE